MKIDLNRFEVFTGLSESEQVMVDAIVKWSELPKNSILFSNGDSSSDFYLVAEGTLRAITYSFSGKEVAYQDISEGEVFGELSAIDHQPRTTGMVAIRGSVIGKISSTDFWMLMESHPAFMRKVVIRLAGLVRFLVGRVYEYSAMDVNDRIRAEIIRHGRDNMTGENSAVIEKMPTHEEVANRVTTHREAVTKEISRLAKSGYIEKQSKKIIIPDLNKLESLLSESV